MSGPHDPEPVCSDPSSESLALEQRLASHDWAGACAELDQQGYARLSALLDREQCERLIALYPNDQAFRSRVIMARHGYGSGEYKYFARPLPPLVEQLRRALYARLAAPANVWMQRLGLDIRFPADLTTFTQRCADSDQTQPTPLLLRYGAGDENRLHQDLYGEQAFPLQAVVLLSAPGREFSGGEFVLTEQRPRMQSRVEVIDLAQGDAAIFTNAVRPVTGARGDYRVRVRHGVSRVRHGQRFALGVIFHDAQ